MLQRRARLGNHCRRALWWRRILCEWYVWSTFGIITRLTRWLGLLITERNYLEVFPYDKWSEKHLPDFDAGSQFMPSICELREGETSAPNLLTEADLVSLMDKNGIGGPFDDSCDNELSLRN